MEKAPLMIDQRYSTKNRIAAVDIARIMAALWVMYEHLQGVAGFKLGVFSELMFAVFGHMSAIFFVLAGFFACRNITMQKALHNCVWCVLPFVLWNVVYVWVSPNLSLMPQGLENSRLGGMGALFGATGIFPLTYVYPESFVPRAPANFPLWFMRDLSVLFLLSPLLYRVAKYLFPLLLFASITPMWDEYFSCHYLIFLSPYSISMFTFGCFLANLTKETKQRLLQYSNPRMVLSYMVFVGCIVYCYFNYDFMRERLVNKSLLESIVGLFIFYQIARWLELHVPYVKQFALQFAPVTFLTFAVHAIVYCVIPESLGTQTVYILLLPILIFASMSLLFFAMKRWTRPLLHLVAHYKLRPDDLVPRQKVLAETGRE